ncbi:MAG TPA: hypothetical protein VN442_06615 [Bryobacteraceae bacterium]|nr:hypothetical protein [Bryobacteraceae bacterium]
MKCISVLLLSAAAVVAADVNFATGQAARLIIGQTQATRQEPGASESLLGGISGVAFANDTLFVADSNRVNSEPINHRVLIFRNVSGTMPKPTDELSYTQRCPICVGQASTVLGQPDFTKTDRPATPTQSSLRLPTAVASDGQRLVVADTDHNRVLIWNTIPANNNQPADIVVGQSNFTSSTFPSTPTATSMRGPQGVWIQSGKLYVADTQNHRILIYNQIPTSNGAAANVVLGQASFTSAPADTLLDTLPPTAQNMLNPVSVTSDGTRLYVTDLGYNRVLIWNSIPTSNQAPADVVVGQPDMTSALANNSFKVENSKYYKVLCESTGRDEENDLDLFPARCEATLEFPRFALSDGQQLFIADGGNDRVLVFKHVPAANGEKADMVIGQLGGLINQASDAADSMRAPMSLAWDGENLYVSDTYNRRINVYSMGEPSIPYSGVRNAASFEIYAVGAVEFSGTIKENDEITLKIGEKEYKYKVVKDDNFENVIVKMVSLINAGEGDPLVFATPNLVTFNVILTARAAGSDGNAVTYSVTSSKDATIVGTAAGANLAGGMDAAKIAPGTLVSIVGDNLADQTAAVPYGSKVLPDELGGVQVYFDGVRSPLMYVSPTQVNAQIPFEFMDTTSISAYVRAKRADGTVTVTTPVAVSIVQENPGIFTAGGQDPRPAVAVHFSSNATGTISVDGSISAGDIATITIEDRAYKYTVVEGDTLDSVRDKLIELINQDPKVRAFAAGVFDRIRLQARVAGPDGNGIPFKAEYPEGQSLLVTATNSALCCANVAGAPVNDANPVVPGETIVVYATGLGVPEPTDQVATGQAWPESAPIHKPREFVSSLAGGKTANVLYAGLAPGQVGVWEVHLELNSDMPTNPFTQVTIAQGEFVSNIVTFPLVNPNPPTTEETASLTLSPQKASASRYAAATRTTMRMPRKAPATTGLR